MLGPISELRAGLNTVLPSRDREEAVALALFLRQGTSEITRSTAFPKYLKNVIRAWLSFSPRAPLGKCHGLFESFEKTETIDRRLGSHVVAGKR